MTSYGKLYSDCCWLGRWVVGGINLEKVLPLDCMGYTTRNCRLCPFWESVRASCVFFPFPQNSTRLCFSLFPHFVFPFSLYFLLFYNFVFRFFSFLRLFFAHFGGVSWVSLLWSCSFFFTPLLTCLTPAFALCCGLTLQLCHSINTL